jgi:hypothetical protein
MEKIAIIEPHYDDAWINLGGYILKNPNLHFRIISISYDGLNNKNETKKLANLLPNIETKPLKFRGIHWNLIHKIKKENYVRYFLKINKIQSLEKVSFAIEKNCRDVDLVIKPLGTLHPQHVVVSHIKIGLPTKHYVEWPYCYEEKRYIDKYMEHAKIIDISDVIKKKIEIFSQVYKTQLDLLEMEPKAGFPLAKTTHEIIISQL